MNDRNTYRSRLQGAGWVLGIWGLMVLMLMGCDGNSQAGGGEELGPEGEDAGMRVISLAPALTQMLVDLELGHLIVGVGENDAAAPEGVPVVGRYPDVNSELVVQLRPTHILTLVGEKGVPSSVEKIANSQKAALIPYPYPTDAAEVGNILCNESEFLPVASGSTQVSLGTLFNIPTEACELKYDMLGRISDLARLTEDQPKVRVLMVFGFSPIMAAGPGTVLDALVSHAGGYNAAGDATVSAPTYDRESLLELNPEVILIFDPAGAELGALDEDPRLADLRGLDVPAVTEDRIVMINDPKALLPSTNLPQLAATMAQALHPEKAEAIDRLMETPLEVPGTPGEAIDPIDLDGPELAPPDALEDEPAPVEGAPRQSRGGGAIMRFEQAPAQEEQVDPQPEPEDALVH